MKGSWNVDKEKIPRPSKFRYSFISSFQRGSFFFASKFTTLEKCTGSPCMLLDSSRFLSADALHWYVTCRLFSKCPWLISVVRYIRCLCSFKVQLDCNSRYHSVNQIWRENNNWIITYHRFSSEHSKARGPLLLEESDLFSGCQKIRISILERVF